MQDFQLIRTLLNQLPLLPTVRRGAENDGDRPGSLYTLFSNPNNLDFASGYVLDTRGFPLFKITGATLSFNSRFQKVSYFKQQPKLGNRLGGGSARVLKDLLLFHHRREGKTPSQCGKVLPNPSENPGSSNSNVSSALQSSYQISVKRAKEKHTS